MITHIATPIAYIVYFISEIPEIANYPRTYGSPGKGSETGGIPSPGLAWVRVFDRVRVSARQILYEPASTRLPAGRLSRNQFSPIS